MHGYLWKEEEKQVVVQSCQILDHILLKVPRTKAKSTSVKASAHLINYPLMSVPFSARSLTCHSHLDYFLLFTMFLPALYCYAK